VGEELIRFLLFPLRLKNNNMKNKTEFKKNKERERIERGSNNIMYFLLIVGTVVNFILLNNVLINL